MTIWAIACCYFGAVAIGTVEDVHPVESIVVLAALLTITVMMRRDRNEF